MTLVDAPVYKESPFSAALVASGDLPPVDERLGTPLVLVVDEVGEYGGVLRRMQTNPLSVHAVGGRISHRGLLRASGDGKGFVPSGAGSYSPNEDATVWTVKTRAGGKWSDGAPNTSEDYRYQWEVLQDPDVMGGGAGWINQSGDPVVQVVVIDEETSEYRYSESNWLFETQVARGHLPWDIPIYPSHYMKQYNANYNPDAQKLAEEAGYESWELYYHANRDQWHNNPNLPSMASYLFENNTANNIVYFSRNHYYNMVDQEGNQLPYIDGMRIGPAKSGGDALALAAAQGEIDFQASGLNISYFTLLKEGEAKGGYNLKLVPDTAGTDISLTFGLTYDGPERELIENKDWRIAISQSINRDDINEALFFGQGTPRNGLPSTDHPFYPGSEYETLYFLDIAASNAALDSLMGPKDSEGFRTMPNGDRFEFVFTTPDAPLQISAAEMMCLDIEDVSVRCLVEPLGGMLRVQRVRASQAMARPAGHCCTGELYMFPGTTLPVSRWGWAPDWGGWYQTGEGEEPPAEVKNLHTLFEGAKLAPENAINSAKEIFTWYAENAVAPGIVGGLGSYAVMVVKDELAGVPDHWANRNGLQSPQNAFPERFYFTSAARRAELPKQLTHCVGCAAEAQEAGFGWAP
jgi:ABC-type transport system substrate-binding protein